jgi:hypothetical protein
MPLISLCIFYGSHFYILNFYVLNFLSFIKSIGKKHQAESSGSALWDFLDCLQHGILLQPLICWSHQDWLLGLFQLLLSLSHRF